MRATSLTHITAVSGAHVAIVLGSVLAILARAPRWIKGVVAAGVLALMVVVVLPTPSVLRASGMGMLTIVAFSRKRPRLALPVLFFTTTLLLAYDPWLATSIGFALSVAATLGILLSAPPLGRFMGGGPLARALAVPTAAQMWCAPLLLTFDASIATYSIPANLLAMPALAPATLTGLASAVVGLFSPRVAGLIAHTGGYFAAWIITVATFFARLPGARLPWWEGTPGVISLIALAVLLMWAVRVISRRRTAPPE